MKNINSITFSQQLEAANLLGLPFAWGDDGTFCFDPSMTQEQIDAVNVVYEAHDPTIPAISPFDSNLVLTRIAEEFSMERMYQLKNDYAVLRDFILFQNFIQLKQYVNLMLGDETATQDDYLKLNSILKEQNIDLDTIPITSEQVLNSDTVVSEE